MSAELASCPFCGKQPEQSKRADTSTSTGEAYFIACMCGGYSANAHQFGDSRAEVLRKWNSRAAQPVASIEAPQASWKALHEFCENYCDNKPQLVACAESAFYWFNKSIAAAPIAPQAKPAKGVEK